MGASADDSEAGDDENPAHLVRLTRPFEMWNTPVTQRQYAEVMGQTPSRFKEGKGEQRPVEQVSWFDAVRYCNALSAKQGLSPAYVIRESDDPDQPHVEWKGLDAPGWRLPTEAEWEYACRAGTRGPRYGKLEDIAWTEENSGEVTHSVATKRANAWGLYDMLGNVWEWCWDWYASYPKGNAVDPSGSGGDYRVRRGGSWFNSAWNARASFRYFFDPVYRNCSLGFRPVRSLTK